MPHDSVPEIVIVEHDPRWPSLYEAEAFRVRNTLGDVALTVEHVGSTAIPGMPARPNIAIAVALRSMADAERCVGPLKDLGYEPLGESGVPGRLLFRRRFGQDGERLHPSFAVHLTEAHSTYWQEHILFRNFLRMQPAVAARYGELKRKLTKEFPNDREAYGDAKASFIQVALGRAKMGPPTQIIIADYDPSWPTMFEEERTIIGNVIGDTTADIQHIGSTSVPGLAAKPIIDIIISVAAIDRARNLCVEPLTTVGYEYVPEYEIVMPERLFFRKGDPRSRHIHMAVRDTAFWRRHIFLRDYLRVHPETAKEYADLKKRLAKEHGTDMDGYTDGN
ncbi:MAG: GrpB family protein [Chloroflexi bacterium]|nr:GrpB family protein [Chloroflexota bacterium]